MRLVRGLFLTRHPKTSVSCIARGKVADVLRFTQPVDYHGQREPIVYVPRHIKPGHALFQGDLRVATTADYTKTVSPVAIEAKSFEFAYPPSEDPQAPRTSIGPLDWRVPQGGVPAACRRDR